LWQGKGHKVENGTEGTRSEGWEGREGRGKDGTGAERVHLHFLKLLDPPLYNNNNDSNDIIRSFCPVFFNTGLRQRLLRTFSRHSSNSDWLSYVMPLKVHD